mmetsp:Transcript_4441/g.12449  ORF Transcript_4441/g.12449 Transcript_4441/m.12449 type:complete len:299 (-) Transcript_4441:144-1040(-)
MRSVWSFVSVAYPVGLTAWAAPLQNWTSSAGARRNASSARRNWRERCPATCRRPYAASGPARAVSRRRATQERPALQVQLHRSWRARSAVFSRLRSRARRRLLPVMSGSPSGSSAGRSTRSRAGLGAPLERPWARASVRGARAYVPSAMEAAAPAAPVAPAAKRSRICGQRFGIEAARTCRRRHTPAPRPGGLRPPQPAALRWPRHVQVSAPPSLRWPRWALPSHSSRRRLPRAGELPRRTRSASASLRRHTGCRKGWRRSASARSRNRTKGRERTRSASNSSPRRQTENARNTRRSG